MFITGADSVLQGERLPKVWRKIEIILPGRDASLRRREGAGVLRQFPQGGKQSGRFPRAAIPCGALPHPLDGGFNSGFRQAKLPAQLCVGESAGITRLIILKNLEQRRLPARLMLSAQPVQGPLHERLCPPEIEDLTGCQSVHRFMEPAFVSCHLLQ